MSDTDQPWATVQHRFMAKLNASANPPALKLTGLVIATFADRDGTNIRPSTATLAEAIGKHPKRVAADRALLVERGWLVLVGEHSRTVGQVDLYRLAVAENERVVKRIKQSYRNRAESDGRLSPEMEALKAKTRWKRENSKGGKGWKCKWIEQVLRNPAYTTPERIVAASLGLEAVAAGTDVHPGIANLERYTHLSNGAVKKALKGLRDTRAIKLLYSGRGDGCGLHDEYLLTEPDPELFEFRLAARDRKKTRQSEALQEVSGRRTQVA